MEIVRVLAAGEPVACFAPDEFEADELVPAMAVPVVQCEAIVIYEDEEGGTIISPDRVVGPNLLGHWLDMLEEREEPFGLIVEEDKFGDERGFVILFEGDPLIPEIQATWDERAQAERELTTALLSRIPV